MPRLMSCSQTVSGVLSRRKTVTRRHGWRHLVPGDHLTLCGKVMGRKRADGTVEPLIRYVDVEVVSVTRERLSLITAEEIAREAVHEELTPSEWAAWFCSVMGGHLDDEVTRIEWRYLDETAGPGPISATTVQT